MWSPHDLRHRRISLLHRQGRTWAEIGALVGQRSLKVTSDTYTHVLVDSSESTRRRCSRDRSRGPSGYVEVLAQLAIPKLALWEPPYVPEGGPRPPADAAATFATLIEEHRRGEAVEFFMAEVVGPPPEFVAGVRSQPFWAGQEALAHTLAYDATIMGDYWLPKERFARVATPTLVLDGGASPPWLGVTAQKLAETLPNGRRQTLEGQQHNVDPEALAPAVANFFRA